MNSGTIRDEPEYEPPAGDYPGVHISRVIPKTIVAPWFPICIPFLTVVLLNKVDNFTIH